MSGPLLRMLPNQNLGGKKTISVYTHSFTSDITHFCQLTVKDDEGNILFSQRFEGKYQTDNTVTIDIP